MEIINHNYELVARQLSQVEIDRSLGLKLAAGSAIGVSLIYLG
jgi:hypothetical protein